jgi:hypothetical protein
MGRYTLAKAMAGQRQRLGYSVVEVIESVGLARSTWRELESGSRSRLTARVGLQIDRALAWEPGTASALFDADDQNARNGDGHNGEGPEWMLQRRGALAEMVEAEVARVATIQLAGLRAQIETLGAQSTETDELLDAWRGASLEARSIALQVLRQRPG